MAPGQLSSAKHASFISVWLQLDMLGSWHLCWWSMEKWRPSGSDSQWDAYSVQNDSGHHCPRWPGSAVSEPFPLWCLSPPVSSYFLKAKISKHKSWNTRRPVIHTEQKQVSFLSNSKFTFKCTSYLANHFWPILTAYNVIQKTFIWCDNARDVLSHPMNKQ